MAPDRFASAAEFAAALQHEGAGTLTRFASAEKARGTAQTRGLRVALGAVAALAMIAMVAAVWGWQRPIAPRSEMVAQLELAAPPGLAHAFRQAIGLLAVSPDGRMMTFAVKTTSGVALAVRSLDQLAARVLPGTSAALYPAFSPDGRWMAYVSDESGRNEVYVRPLAPRGGRVAVSSGGGGEPLWSRDGRRLFYRAGSTLMVADIATTPQLAVGARMVLFEGPFETDGLHPNYDVLPDGSGFIMLRTNEESWRLVLVINWAAELRQRLGGGKQVLVTMVIDYSHQERKFHGMSAKPTQTISISEFKATCLAVLERVRRTGTSIVVTKRGEPVAEINPPSPASTGKGWLGSMRGTATMMDDLIAPASATSDWDALSP